MQLSEYKKNHNNFLTMAIEILVLFTFSDNEQINGYYYLCTY